VNVNVEEATLTIPISRPDGGDVVARARRGDLEAFEEIIRLHERPVLRLATRLLNNREDAKDAAQEVFIRLHRSLGSIEETRAVGPWLYRVTVNICTDVIRSRRKTVGIETVSLAAANRRADESIDQEQRRAVLMAAVAELPEKERMALVLREMEEIPTKDVAGMLGSTEATVRSQVASARIRLRKIIEKLTRRKQ
jgi:RNA polymerase sigma-70 factor (ECF subfamily)